MPLDPRIAMGFQSPQFESPVNMMGDMMKMKSMQQQNALAEQQISALRQAQEREAQLDAAYSGAYNPETGKLDYNNLLQKVPGRVVPEILRGRAEFRELNAKADKEELGYATSFLSAAKDALRPGMSLDQVLSVSRATHKDPVLGPLLERLGIDPAQTEAETRAAFEAGRGDDHILQMSMGAEKFANAIKNVDLDGEQAFVSPTGRKLRSLPKTLSPDEESRINREFNPNTVAHVATDENGNLRFFNAQGGEVKPGAGKGAGKPSGAVITARQKGEKLKGDINNVISEFERILKPGGLLDQSTGSGAGAMVDAVAGFGGVATEGAIAIGQLQPVADLSLKLVERFEGPQSDSDRISYKEASANVANASLPIPIRKAAAATVLRILKKRRDQFGYRDADGSVVTGGAAPSTSGGSDIDALVNKHRTQ